MTYHRCGEAFPFGVDRNVVCRWAIIYTLLLEIPVDMHGYDVGRNEMRGLNVNQLKPPHIEAHKVPLLEILDFPDQITMISSSFPRFIPVSFSLSVHAVCAGELWTRCGTTAELLSGYCIVI